MKSKWKNLPRWRDNSTLYIGMIMIATLFFISLFGGYLVDPQLEDQQVYRYKENIARSEVAPFPPSWKYWLGSDTRGIDMVKKVIIGAKYTFLAVVLIGFSRIAISLPLGLIVGWFHPLKGVTTGISRAWGAVPMFLIVYFLLAPISRLDSNTISLTQKLIIYWFVLTVVGLPGMIETIANHVQRIRRLSFMDGVKVLGGNWWHTLRKHVLPHLRSHLYVLVSAELVQVLWLFGQLAIFGIFIGAVLEPNYVSYGYQYVGFTFDWAAMFQEAKGFMLPAPWIIFTVSLAFAYATVSFTLLSEGLKKWEAKSRLEYTYEDHSS